MSSSVSISSSLDDKNGLKNPLPTPAQITSLLPANVEHSLYSAREMVRSTVEGRSSQEQLEMEYVLGTSTETKSVSHDRLPVRSNSRS